MSLLHPFCRTSACRIGPACLGLFLGVLLTNCKPADEPVVREYLFLGHPYDWNDGYRLDPRLETIDYDQLDMVWLGGDVCSRTTEGPRALAYLDSLFRFGDGRVHWTLGNHDVMYGEVARITQTTGRPAFYTTGIEGGLTLMVLNTNLFWMAPSRPPQEDCDQKQAQFDMIRSVLDTIAESSHLVILHHHSLLKEVKPDSLQEAFNIDPGSVAVTCALQDQFTDAVYPLLVRAQQRGVQVVMVGGDLGMRVKRFAYRSPEGIWLLGSGINNSLNPVNAPEYVTNFEPDQVLLFRHLPAERELTWSFVLLDEFIQQR